eukprot:10907144-Karenia_brevis.AAC.1
MERDGRDIHCSALPTSTTKQLFSDACAQSGYMLEACTFSHQGNDILPTDVTLAEAGFDSNTRILIWP